MGGGKHQKWGRTRNDKGDHKHGKLSLSLLGKGIKNIYNQMCMRALPSHAYQKWNHNGFESALDGDWFV